MNKKAKVNVALGVLATGAIILGATKQRRADVLFEAWEVSNGALDVAPPEWQATYRSQADKELRDGYTAFATAMVVGSIGLLAGAALLAQLLWWGVKTGFYQIARSIAAGVRDGRGAPPSETG